MSGWKIDPQLGGFIAHLYRFAVQLVVLDITEHFVVHQNIEYGVIALLVDQGAGLERLIPAFLDHRNEDDVVFFLLGEAVVVRLASLGSYPFVPKGRLLCRFEHDVEERFEMGVMLPMCLEFGPRLRIFDRRSVGWGIQGDEGQPRVKIETALPVVQRRELLVGVSIDAVLARQPGIQKPLLGVVVNRYIRAFA